MIDLDALNRHMKRLVAHGMKPSEAWAEVNRFVEEITGGKDLVIGPRPPMVEPEVISAGDLEERVAKIREGLV